MFGRGGSRRRGRGRADGEGKGGGRGNALLPFPFRAEEGPGVGDVRLLGLDGGSGRGSGCDSSHWEERDDRAVVPFVEGNVGRQGGVELLLNVDVDVDDGWQGEGNEFMLDCEGRRTEVRLDVLAEHRVVKVVGFVFRVWGWVRVEGKGAEDVDGEGVVCWTEGGDADWSDGRYDGVIEEIVVGRIVGVGAGFIVVFVVVVVIGIVILVVIVVAVVVVVMAGLVAGVRVGVV